MKSGAVELQAALPMRVRYARNVSCDDFGM
jgi:hypothetical protein